MSTLFLECYSRALWAVVVVLHISNFTRSKSCASGDCKIAFWEEKGAQQQGNGKKEWEEWGARSMGADLIDLTAFVYKTWNHQQNKSDERGIISSRTATYYPEHHGATQAQQKKLSCGVLVPVHAAATVRCWPALRHGWRFISRTRHPGLGGETQRRCSAWAFIGSTRRGIPTTGCARTDKVWCLSWAHSTLRRPLWRAVSLEMLSVA